MTEVTEKLFEDAIADDLVAYGGYDALKFGSRPEWSGDFDAALGLDTTELFALVAATQAKSWQTVVMAHGGDPAYARQRFAQRLASQIDEWGSVDVLRDGVMARNVRIDLADFKPAHGVTEELVAKYEANRLTHAATSVREGQRKDA